jgi:hypothetical protein
MMFRFAGRLLRVVSYVNFSHIQAKYAVSDVHACNVFVHVYHFFVLDTIDWVVVSFMNTYTAVIIPYHKKSLSFCCSSWYKAFKLDLTIFFLKWHAKVSDTLVQLML